MEGFWDPPPNRQTAFSFVISVHKLLFCFIRVKSHFKSEGIFRVGPPHFDGHNVFSLLSAFLIFSKGYIYIYIYKRSAEGAAGAVDGGGRFFFGFYGPKINLEKIRKFWEFFAIYIF